MVVKGSPQALACSIYICEYMHADDDYYLSVYTMELRNSSGSMKRCCASCILWHWNFHIYIYIYISAGVCVHCGMGIRVLIYLIGMIVCCKKTMYTLPLKRDDGDDDGWASSHDC